MLAEAFTEGKCVEFLALKVQTLNVEPYLCNKINEATEPRYCVCNGTSILLFVYMYIFSFQSLLLNFCKRDLIRHVVYMYSLT